MNLDHLAAFERIVREGGFGRAALALGVQQSTVSARVQALEEAVGGALFTRGRRVTLTALGEAFLPHARRALEIVGEGLDAARLAQTGRRGKVRLASLASLAGGLVGPAVSSLLRSRPEVDLTVRSGDHELVVAQLVDGLAELGILTWPCVEAEASQLQPLLGFREPVPLVVGRGHPLARRAGGVTQDELARESRPFIRLRWWKAHAPEVTRIAERSGVTQDLPMETARQLLLTGVGAGFFTRTYVADDLARGELVAVATADLAPLTRESALVRRRRSVPLSPAAAALVDALRAQADRLGILLPAEPRGGPATRRSGPRRSR